MKQKQSLLKKSYLAILAALPISGWVWATVVQPQTAPTEYKMYRVVQELPMPTITPPQNVAYWYDEEVQTGDNLSLVLGRLGVSENSIQNFLKESPVDTKMLQLRAGQIISARVDTNQEVTDVQFFNDDDNGERNLIAIEKVNGKWQMHTGAVDTTTMPSLRSVIVTTSASGALARAGVPVEVRTNLKEIFGDKVNLDELNEGDQISLLYESLYFRGQEVATGNILAAEIQHAGQTYHAYYFEHGDAGGNYYDEHGKALKKGFDGQPIEYFTRISSPFGIRVHPIFQTVRMHTGIDYAAPVGTKILAPSDGVVSFVGVKGGYGNTIMLRHSNGMESLYGHMSAFISGITEGTHVKVGDVIGLVGSTGRSTGPHLHYEIRIGGQPVNPATVALPTPKLTATDLAALRQYQQKTNDTLATVRDLPVMVSQKD